MDNKFTIFYHIDAAPCSRYRLVKLSHEILHMKNVRKRKTFCQALKPSLIPHLISYLTNQT
jgi:hypothetical protein